MFFIPGPRVYLLLYFLLEQAVFPQIHIFPFCFHFFCLLETLDSSASGHSSTALQWVERNKQGHVWPFFSLWQWSGHRSLLSEHLLVSHFLYLHTAVSSSCLSPHPGWLQGQGSGLCPFTAVQQCDNGFPTSSVSTVSLSQWGGG